MLNFNCSHAGFVPCTSPYTINNLTATRASSGAVAQIDGTGLCGVLDSIPQFMSPYAAGLSWQTTVLGSIDSTGKLSVSADQPSIVGLSFSSSVNSDSSFSISGYGGYINGDAAGDVSLTDAGGSHVLFNSRLPPAHPA